MSEDHSRKIEIPLWIKNMPKAVLHQHLASSQRIETILELASNYGVTLPSENAEGLRKHIVFKNRPTKSLAGYLDAVKICESVLVSSDAFKRVAYEICEDSHKENVQVLELRFGPTNYERSNLKLPEIIEATLDGLRNGARDFNMSTGLIICGIRTDSDATKRAAQIAVNYQDRGVVGFDLAGKENGFGPALFQEAIKPVLRNFLPVTIHAGEDDDVKSIEDAVIYLHAERIGHALSMRENPRLMKYFNSTRKGLEICITSNLDTGSVFALDTHPVKMYYENGLRINISPDNPLVSNTNTTREYSILINYFGFTKKDIHRIAAHSFKNAFLDDAPTKIYLNQLDNYFLNINDNE